MILDFKKKQLIKRFEEETIPYLKMDKTPNNPILTIIIPTYNSATTIEVALESIVKQTVKDIEILIMDGLSIDNTLEIVERFKLEFQNITIISEKDKGIYDAMNKGVLIAKGTWLYFMGSDDSLYESTTIEQFLGNSNIENNEVVYGNVYSTYFNGSYDGLFTYSKLVDKNICHQALFFRKSVFNNIGKYNLKYRAHADWDHNIRWFFSPKVSRIHIDQIIANFAYGGFSSVFDDVAFRRDKNFLLLSKGIGKLTVSELLSCCINSIYFAKQERNFFKLFVAYFLKFGLKILEK
jgi:glycosyltransferase involved in cell wall biosynthesis